ncbi:hypothetical protein [Streptomyces rimosus]|uniref:hypothetical protein n=1 Tax=Streptomyces rimosus TaxID=1927 RepID=UPI0006C190F8|nr:hypothetical protein [Streptomyces rimosus]KOT59848.1 hypothetical protein ADK45_20395 [Streptomyces rimosus subsp. rimosus]
MPRRGLMTGAAAAGAAGAGPAPPLTAADAGAPVRPVTAGASGATVTAAAPAAPAPPPTTVTAPGPAQLRLNGKPPAERTPVRHYEIHPPLPDGKRRYLGGTCEAAFFLPAPRRTPGGPGTRLDGRAAGEPHTASASAASVFTW